MGASASLVDPASERWRAGEYAECVNATGWFGRSLQRSQRGPTYGEVREVRATGAAWDPFDGKLVQTLIFERWPGCAYPARGFRKVTPRPDEPGSVDRHFLKSLLRLGRMRRP